MTDEAGRKTRGPYNVKGTIKQRAYLAGLAEGKSKRRAAYDAGFRGKPSVVVASLERSAFNQAVHEALAEAGVTLQSVAEKIRELMDAAVEEAFVTRAGEVVYAKEQVLADIQLKATQLAANLLGLSSKARQAVAKEKLVAGASGNILVLAQRYEHLSDEQLEEAMQLMRVGQFTGSPLEKQVSLEHLPDTTTDIAGDARLNDEIK